MFGADAAKATTLTCMQGQAKGCHLGLETFYFERFGLVSVSEFF